MLKIYFPAAYSVYITILNVCEGENELFAVHHIPSPQVI